jgi:hypothetical protein
MVARSTSCPECGYQPIGPYTDNCPICAASVRMEEDDTSGAGERSGETRQQFPPMMIVGWVVIGCVSYWLFSRDFSWLLLMAGSCGAAWWLVSHPTSKRLTRVLAGIYLGLLLLGMGVANQTDLLPGLDRGLSKEEAIGELLQIVQGRGPLDPRTLESSRRMKSWIQYQLLFYPLGVVPPFFLVPPLLRRRDLALLPLNGPTCVCGLILWVGLIPLAVTVGVPGQLSKLLEPPPPPRFDFLKPGGGPNVLPDDEN